MALAHGRVRYYQAVAPCEQESFINDNGEEFESAITLCARRMKRRARSSVNDYGTNARSVMMRELLCCRKRAAGSVRSMRVRVKRHGSEYAQRARRAGARRDTSTTPRFEAGAHMREMSYASLLLACALCRRMLRRCAAPLPRRLPPRERIILERRMLVTIGSTHMRRHA